MECSREHISLGKDFDFEVRGVQRTYFLSTWSRCKFMAEHTQGQGAGVCLIVQVYWEWSRNRNLDGVVEGRVTRINDKIGNLVLIRYDFKRVIFNFLKREKCLQAHVIFLAMKPIWSIGLSLQHFHCPANYRIVDKWDGEWDGWVIFQFPNSPIPQPPNPRPMQCNATVNVHTNVNEWPTHRRNCWRCLRI